MRTKMNHLCKRGMALLLAVALCITLLPGMAVEAAPPKTISASVKFYNHTGSRITELYFEDSRAKDYGEEYLATRRFRYWSNNKYIMVPLEFKKSTSIDIFVRYSDGSAYEAKGLKLAKAKASGSVIDLTKPKVALKVKNKKVASVKFVKRENAKPRVTGVSLNRTTATLMEGQTMNLTATVRPSGANKKVTWKSSNTSVASVSSTGRVTGRKAGTATITAKTKDGGYTAACRVTVTEKVINASINFYNNTGKQITELYFEDSDSDDYGEEYLSASGLTGWGNKTTIKVPLTFTKDAALDFYIRCSDGSAYEAKGLKLARAQANGTKIEFTLVRVSLSVNGTLKNTAAFKKVVSENVAGVKLNKTSLSLKTGSSATLTATVSPRGANKSVTWTSSNTSVATVSSTGKVTGISAGTATITATTVEGGYTASCQVTVTAKQIVATINFYNNTGKQINELYFVESGNSSWDKEYLATQNLKYFTAGKYIRVPLTFTSDASLDFYIRCDDGSAYEARGLSLAKAKASGTKIQLTESKVILVVDGVTAATAAFVQKEASSGTGLSDADWAALQDTYAALVKAYNDVASLYNSDQIKADKDIEAVMKEAKQLIDQMGTIDRAGLSTADGQKLMEAMKDTAEALVKIVEAMEVVPAVRTINVRFINGTTVDFTNFSAKPQGGTGSTPVTLKKDFGETTLQFTVADNVNVFEITFVESANGQPYTLPVTFDSSVKDGDTLTIQFNVDEATQKIVYSQK